MHWLEKSIKIKFQKKEENDFVMSKKFFQKYIIREIVLSYRAIRKICSSDAHIKQQHNDIFQTFLIIYLCNTVRKKKIISNFKSFPNIDDRNDFLSYSIQFSISCIALLNGYF